MLDTLKFLLLFFVLNVIFGKYHLIKTGSGKRYLVKTKEGAGAHNFEVGGK